MFNRSNVAIFSHPRSGSYWFQESLPHFDMNELFNISNVSIIKLGSDSVICSDYQSKKFSSDEKIFEYQRRSKLFDSVLAPKSVKIHHFQLYDDWIFEWILSRNMKIIFFERIDKANSFYSLLISNELRKFKGTHTTKEIKINLNNIDECYKSIFSVSDRVNILKEKFDCYHFYYENLLNSSVKWLDKSKPKIIKQDTVQSVKITNKEEVDNFIKNRYDISNRRIF